MHTHVGTLVRTDIFFNHNAQYAHSFGSSPRSVEFNAQDCDIVEC